MRAQKPFAIVAACSCLISQVQAQGPQQLVEKSHAPIGLRSYIGATVPPPNVKNGNRLNDLIRAGKLYLTVQDAIAIAIENNLDLEVNRYGPVNAIWGLKRAEAGGPLRGVTSGNTLINQATSGQGIAGSQQAAGLGGGGGGGNAGGGGAVVSQIGPVTQNLDAVFQNATAFSHRTTPQANTIQSRTFSLIEGRRIHNSFVQQGLLSGGFVQVSANESYLRENTPSDILNPSVAPVVQIFARHNFLQGFGVGVNSRFIRVARKNVTSSQETFRSQLLNLTSSVLNLYWDLVADYDDLKVRQRAVDQSQKTYDDTKKQIDLGFTPRVDIYRAESDLSARRQALAISQSALHLQENLLKQALSRNGLEDPLIDAAEIVPLDSIQVPDQDDLPPLRELVARAMKNRPDVALANINDETQEISALGTANGVLPILQGITAVTSSGLAGVSVPQPNGLAADPYYVGGLGTALGQVFRNNFPNRRAAVVFQGSIGNHIAQADYGIDQLQLRQGDLVKRRNMNQLVVDVSNQMVALRQARARYAQAVDSRKLQEELLEKSQQMFSFGTARLADVVAAQSSLVAAQSTEVAARSAYSHARISLDQVLGETLIVNHVSVEEALNGRVSRESKPPDAPPDANR
jgi:outer membrane protein